jgi:hypothetical protein
LHEFLRQRLHATQQLGRYAETDHLERTDRLVQLLARNTQLAGVEFGRDRNRARVRRRARNAARPCWQPSSDLRSSSRTQASGPRSLAVESVSASGNVCLHLLVGSCGLQRSTGWPSAILNRATDWRNSSAMRDNSRTWLAVAGAFTGLFGHGKNVLDVVGHRSLAKLASRSADV